MAAAAERAPGFVGRHYTVFAVAVLGLAAFNLTFRLGSEFVAEWDESLYAISAWEAVDKGHWLGTTFMGALDYYNTKPPLNVWLIALSFKAFGTSMESLRLVSVLSAWLTVAVLQVWTRRCFGPMVALLGSLVLATTFGFFHVHSGRTANTDALYTLLVLLTVVMLWAETRRPWLRIWLGPILAAAFLLRGMAVLMPLALVSVVQVSRGRRERTPWVPTIAALGLFLAPVAGWAVARYRLDAWQFLRPMVMYDFVAATIRPIEEHSGGSLYYLNVLQKNHYDWLLAGAVAWLLFPVPWPRVRAWCSGWRRTEEPKLLLAAWAGITLAVPTIMQTKVPWYLNTFYPVFAVGIALILARGFSFAASSTLPRWRVVGLSVVVVLMLGVAETKLLWYSFHYRDLRLSDQSLMLEERSRLAGHRLYQSHPSRAGTFVATAMVGAEPQDIVDRANFLRDSRPGDYLLSVDACDTPGLDLVRSNGRDYLCRRRSETRR